MANIRHPRRGSLQYWPRKRARYTIARVRSWVSESKVKPLGFIGFKAGMTHLIVTDNHPKSLTKGEQIALASTIVECPPMVVMGISFYKKTLFGLQKFTSVLAPQLSKELARTLPLPKKPGKVFPSVNEVADVRLVVHPKAEGIPAEAKKPALLEVPLGGNVADKIKYAQEMLGKEISITDVFNPGNTIDVHGITKGKGFQGTVKRFGVPVRQHKAEKTKRGIGTLGSWHPNRVEFSVAQSGKMGYHLRTEYNKQIIKIGQNGNDVNPTGGITKYGLIRQPYVLVKGSVTGPRKRAVVLTHAIRPNKGFTKEAPEVVYISRSN